MHSYRLVFTTNANPEHQGFVQFPESVTPHLPSIGDLVHFVAMNGEDVHGKVDERSFVYELAEDVEENLVKRTLVRIRLDELD
jgi:hypothetical protein